MKRASLLLFTLLLALPILAASPREESPFDPHHDRRKKRAQPPLVSVFKPVSLNARAVAEAETAARTAAVSGQRPIVLLETNYYTFLPGDSLQLRLSLYPNGFASPVTIYLYREDRVTGQRAYYSLGEGGLVSDDAGADLFGTIGNPLPILVPTLEDFVLFGSASDESEIGWGADGALGSSFVSTTNDGGLHQWVVEIRDAAGSRVISRSNAMYSHVTETVSVSGTITSSTTWTADKRYVLNDFVLVSEPAVLTIEPGTVIYGGDGQASLFIQRGAKIIADGTNRRPIVFTSPQTVGSRAQRDWGSLILLGRAPINNPGGEEFLEGLPSQPAYAFGGDDPADSSGVLRYVRLEFGGFEIVANQEINGLTLGAVGQGTTIDYVEVIHNKDDAFEFFGGTVNARHLLSVGVADDSIDWDLGYQGDIQFVAVVKRGVTDENDGNILIEGDGHSQDFTLTPLSNPRVYNVTGIGTGRTDVGAYGTVLRRGSAGKMFNLVVTGSRRAPVTIRDDATHGNAVQGELMFNSSILHGDFSDEAFASSSDRSAQTRDFLFQTMTRNRNLDPRLAIGSPDQIRTLMPDLRPLEDSPALDIEYVATPPDNGFFEAVNYIGAVGPGEDWILSGWAIFSDN